MLEGTMEFLHFYRMNVCEVSCQDRYLKSNISRSLVLGFVDTESVTELVADLPKLKYL